MARDCALATKAAMLHDIGKVCLRASGLRETHSKQGADFLKPFVGTSDEGRQIIRCIRYHHGRELGGQAARLPEDDLAFLVYEADNIAAGTDRRGLEEGVDGEEAPEAGKPKPRWETYANLENIFNIFSGQGAPSSFSLKELNGDQFDNYPFPGCPNGAAKGQYQAIVETLKQNFARKNPVDMAPNELLRILEDTMIYVPSSTNRSEACDISLYDHVKITAAVAGAMFRYFEAHHIENLKKTCFTDGKAQRDTPMFLLVSGDFSGIQDFIYRVPTKGAMRMLRGRSAYLDIMLENMADALLEKLGLSRANLIYSGGGHFYILADNTEETISVLQEGFRDINRSLLKWFSASLYLASAWTAVTANELMGQSASSTSMFRRVSETMAKAKLKRYDEDTLEILFSTESAVNEVSSSSRECALCHRSGMKLEPYAPSQMEEDASEGMEVCPFCNNLYLLGKYLIERKETDHTLLAVLSAEREGALPLPVPDGEEWLHPIFTEDIEKLEQAGILVRLYDKNGSRTAEKMATRLWMADYAARDEEGHVKDFKALSAASGEGEEGKGIRRLGVLRADVDGLGAAFMAGFRRKGLDHPNQYGTLSRYSALSRSLSVFFKRIIREVAEKHLPQGMKPFYLFQDKGAGKRDIHIVYAGGDDLFIVGAWDDLLEFVVDLRRTFAAYTNGKLTFSAGLGLFSDAYPVISMASAAGELEDEAKGAVGKDHIALFGSGTEMNRERGYRKAPSCRWNVFTDVVVGEKVRFLLDHFSLIGINSEEAGADAKLSGGKSLLYRMLLLLRDKPFNLARFAYTLARMEPSPKEKAEKRAHYDKVRTTWYRWAVDAKEREQFETALQMVIYRMRDK